MTTILKPGTRLFGAACTTEVIVVRAPQTPVEILIGGQPILLSAADRADGLSVAAGHEGPSQMGKRYVDETGTVELLCTKAGAGLPAVGDLVCGIKDAKPLPSSD